MLLPRPMRIALNILLAAVVTFQSPAYAAAKAPKGTVSVTSKNQNSFVTLGKEKRDTVLCRVQGVKGGGIDVGFVKKDKALKLNLWKSFKTVLKEIKSNKSLTAKQRKKQTASYTTLQAKYLQICAAVTSPTATPTTVPSATPTEVASATPTNPGPTPTNTSTPTSTPTATATSTPTPTPTPTATPTNTPTPEPTVDAAIARWNAGGPDYTSPSTGATWVADETAVVQNTGIYHPLPEHSIGATELDPLYAKERNGTTIKYNLPSVPPAVYEVVLHFAEIFHTAPGERLMSVSFEGGAVQQTNIDIVALAGGADNALTLSYAVPVNDGELNIVLNGGTAPSDTMAKISAIEVRPQGGTSADDLYRLSCGADGVEYTDPQGLVWADDAFFVFGGNNTFTNSSAQIAGTDDDTLYQSERYGINFGYALGDSSNPLPNGSYDVALHFAEIFFTEPGSRTFDVSIEGNKLLSNFDIVAAGLPNTPPLAIVKHFQVSVTDGQLNIDFSRRINFAKVSAISVTPLSLAVSPSFHDFGNQASGTQSAPFPVNLKNNASTAITINAVDFASPTQDFTVQLPPGVPYTLNPGDQVTALVRFNPQVLGAKEAIVNIQTTDATVANGLYTLLVRGHSDAEISFLPPEKIVGNNSPGMANFLSPTSVQLGPDGRLYVSQLDGRLWAITLNGDHTLNLAVPVVEIDTIHLSPNVNADGSPAQDPNNPGSPLVGRQVTGFFVDGTPSQPVIYVTHSDPRIGGLQANGPVDPLQIDTDGGVLTRLIGPDFNNPANRADLVKGLPRSRENHGPNAVNVHDGWIYIALAGNSNWGGTYNEEFGNMPEVNLSASIVRFRMPENLSDPVTTLDVSAGSQIGSLPGDGEVLNMFEVYATGYRNPYDFLWHSNGRLYANVNAGNPGFGPAPGEDPNCPGPLCTEYACTDRNFTEPDPSDPPLDMLALINAGDYGGHPVPARGFCILDSGTYYTPNVSAEIGYHAPIHRYGGPIRPQSVNGIAEYISTSAFGGQMSGDIISAVTFEPNSIRRIHLSADGSQVLSDTTIAEGESMSFGPLDLTVDPDGTIYVTGFYPDASSIMILRPATSCQTPNDLDCDGLSDDLDLDDDGDGYSDLDEISAGSNPRNPASRPADFDGDFISDQNDPDDDNDGVPDTTDRFIIDASNGGNTALPVTFTWDPGSPALGKLRGTGFTGYMLRSGGAGYIPARVAQGGAGGFMSIIPTEGTLETNTQDNALQIGLNSDPSTGLGQFTVTTRVTDAFKNPLNPPAGAEGAGVIDRKSVV